jgi:APA family basic amino acid/polyamine antiporter
MNTQDPWGERLPRKLGLWSAVAILVGSSIGSGIFRVPTMVAGRLHEPGLVLLAWAIGGLIALCGALTFAELAAAFPRSGGIFTFLLEAFGPLPAFLFGWAQLSVVRASVLGGIATIFAEYLGYFLHFTPAEIRYVAAAAVVVVGLLNYLGVKNAAVFMNLTTMAKYAAVAGLALLAFLNGNGSAANFTPLWGAGGAAVPFSLIATALIGIMWTYDGWADISFMGGEVKQPQRTLPAALILGTTSLVVVYLLVNLAYIYLVPLPEMAQSKLIATTAAERIPLVGGLGAAIIAGVVMLATFSALNGAMMTGPRIFFAMADRGLFFRGLGRISPKFQTPSVAIWLATGLGVVYVLQNDFAQLADKFILGIWPFYALSIAAVFVLRRTRPDLERPYRTWGYPVVPLLFLLASLGLVVNALVTDPRNTGITFAIVLAGIPVYYLWRLFAAGRSAGGGSPTR